MHGHILPTKELVLGVRDSRRTRSSSTALGKRPRRIERADRQSREDGGQRARLAGDGGEKPLRMSRPRISLLAVVLLAGGCMVGPDYQRPETPPAASWGEVGRGIERGRRGNASPAALAEWWTSLRDPVLIGARRSRRSLRTSHSSKRLRACAPRARCARSPRRISCRPCDADGASRARAELERLSPLGKGVHDVYQGGFDASWELDLFGGISPRRGSGRRRRRCGRGGSARRARQSRRRGRTELRELSRRRARARHREERTSIRRTPR